MRNRVGPIDAGDWQVGKLIRCSHCVFLFSLGFCLDGAEITVSGQSVDHGSSMHGVVSASTAERREDCVTAERESRESSINVLTDRAHTVQPSLSVQRRRHDSSGWLSINGLYQVTTHRFRDSVKFRQNVEDGTTVTDYVIGRAPAFDVSGGFRLSRRVGIGIGSTYMRQSRVSTDTTTNVPHPFYFDRPRSVSGPASTDRSELGFHFQAVGVIPSGTRTTIMVFGGPSVFRVNQGLVTGVTTTEGAYPFRSVAFERARLANPNVTAWGFNVGVDVSVFFTDGVGVGGLVRFARATTDMPSADGDAIRIEPGGLHVGGGVRFRF